MDPRERLQSEAEAAVTPTRFLVTSYMVALRKHPPSRMTLAEFFAWDPQDPSVRHWQLIDGEPVAMAPASENHAALQTEVSGLIREHLIARGLPCRVLSEAGVVPRVRHDRNYRIPDLAVTCAPPSNSLMVNEPILLIEILSPSNEIQTWANIWTYTTMPSVTEILVVYSTRIEAELLRRNADGSWPEQPERIGPETTARLESIGFPVDLQAFYRTTGLVR